MLQLTCVGGHAAAASHAWTWRSTPQHLRHVEKDVLIPKIVRQKARERCSEQVQDFPKCCKGSGILMLVKCRKENSSLKECVTAYYNDPAFYEECKMEYLKEREEFRETGIPTKKRLQKLPTSMSANIQMILRNASVHRNHNHLK